MIVNLGSEPTLISMEGEMDGEEMGFMLTTGLLAARMGARGIRALAKARRIAKMARKARMARNAFRRRRRQDDY